MKLLCSKFVSSWTFTHGRLYRDLHGLPHNTYFWNNIKWINQHHIPTGWIVCPKLSFYKHLSLIADKWGQRTTKTSIKIFLAFQFSSTMSRDIVELRDNYRGQLKVKNSTIHFSMSKIDQLLLNFFSLKNIREGEHFYCCHIFSVVYY